MKKGMVLGCVVLGLMMLLSSEVMAQSPYGTVDVTRAEEALAVSSTPSGKITFGNLKIIPALALEEVYDDNIYLTNGSNNTTEQVVSDWIFHAKPAIAFDYTLPGRGSVQVGYAGDFAYYADTSFNDWHDNTGFLKFDYQAPGGLVLGLNEVYANLSDPYGAPNQFGLGVPQTKRWIDNLNTKAGWNFSNQFMVLGYYNYYIQDYQQESDFTQDYDVNEFGLGLQTRLGGKTWGFLRYHYGYQDFYSTPAGSGVTDQNNASFHYNRVSTGLTWDSGAKFAGELNFGYIWVDYDNPIDSQGNPYENKNTWNAATNINYFATPTTTLSLAIARALRNTGSNTAQFYTDTGVSLGLAQVFLQKFTLTAQAAYARYDYNIPTNPTETQDNYLGSIGVNYQIWNWLNAGVAYTYLKKESNYPANDYTDNRVIFSLRGVY
jgi:hypothetical protein